MLFHKTKRHKEKMEKKQDARFFLKTSINCIKEAEIVSKEMKIIVSKEMKII